MEKLIEAIRAATASDASDEARAAGAQACRTLLQVLEAKQGEPLVTAVAAEETPVAAVVAALRGTPLDQLMDLAIAKLRAALPPDATSEMHQPAIQLVPIPHRLTVQR